MKLAILPVLVASAAAFAPASQKASSAALSAKSPYAGELGAQVPVSTTNLVEDNDDSYHRPSYLQCISFLCSCCELIVA
jgi:hypothetical protein